MPHLRYDIVLAARSSTFGHPEQTLGITMLMGGIYRVAERAGRAFAAELGFTSQTVAAEVMEAHGIVNRVVADQGCSPDRVGPLTALPGNPGAIARLIPPRRRLHILCDAPYLSRFASQLEIRHD